MTPRKQQSILTINDTAIHVAKLDAEDYICLTDMAKSYGADRVVESWLRNKNTIEFLGIWETLNNPGFNSHEFVGIKNQAGLNRFNISAKEWISKTSATGIIAKTGRYGGTYAHKDIAFEFGTWLSPEFKLLIIKEFQRLKANEQHQMEWDSKRYLSRVNYRLHTAAIKEILPTLKLPRHKQGFVYASEADMLNEIIFGQTALEWRQENGKELRPGDNQRDHASITQLVVLANLESLNSMLISQGKSQAERLHILYEEARRQYQAFISANESHDGKQLGTEND